MKKRQWLAHLKKREQEWTIVICSFKYKEQVKVKTAESSEEREKMCMCVSSLKRNHFLAPDECRNQSSNKLAAASNWGQMLQNMSGGILIVE